MSAWAANETLFKKQDKQVPFVAITEIFVKL